MHGTIIQTLADIHQEHFDLAILPSQTLHKRPLADTGQALHEDHAQEPDALFPLLAVAGPAADGELVADLGDVVEAVGPEQVRDPVDQELFEAQAREAELHVVAEVAEGVRGGWVEGVVIALWPVVEFLKFNIATWFEVSDEAVEIKRLVVNKTYSVDFLFFLLFLPFLGVIHFVKKKKIKLTS